MKNQRPTLTRRLIDYKKLSHELAALLIETYPYGYGDEDIIAFKNANGDHVQAVELRTEDCLYLVKISKSLASFIENFEETIEKELEITTEPILEEVDASEMEQEFDNDFEPGEDQDYE